MTMSARVPQSISDRINDLADDLGNGLHVDNRMPPWTEPRRPSKQADCSDQDKGKSNGTKRRSSMVIMGPHCRQLFGVVPREELEAFLSSHVSYDRINMLLIVSPG